MILCIDGSDIRTLVLATYEHIEDGTWQRMKNDTFAVSPEEYLGCITAFTHLDDAEGIVLVQGPGSATALRASFAIANTFAMTRKIPLYGIPQGTSWEAVLTVGGPANGVEYMEPVYASAAKITPGKKDSLRRQM